MAATPLETCPAEQLAICAEILANVGGKYDPTFVARHQHCKTALLSLQQALQSPPIKGRLGLLFDDLTKLHEIIRLYPGFSSLME